MGVTAELERCVAPGGYVLDDASEELAEARTLRRENTKELNALMTRMAKALFQQGGAERVEVRPFLQPTVLFVRLFPPAWPMKRLEAPSFHRVRA